MRAWIGPALVVVLAGCSKRGPRDVGPRQNPVSVFEDGPPGSRRRTVDAGASDGAVPLVAALEIARADARALAVTPTHLFFGDTQDDELYALEKGQPTPVRIARRAPMPGAVSVDGATVVWIGTPGDIVLRVPATGGTAATIRDRSFFVDVVASAGDVFITEAHEQGGSLTRTTGASSTKLASFEGTPRGIAVDTESVFIASSTHLYVTPRTRDGLTPLAHGNFMWPRLDGGFLYARQGTSVVRVKKGGGELEVVATGVREAPIAVHGGVVYWFDAERPVLMAGKTSFAEAASFVRINALEVDDDAAYVATGYGEGASIVRVPLR